MSCFKYSFHLFDSVRRYFKFFIIILYIYYIYIYLYIIYARIYIYVYVYYIFINIGFPHIIQVKTEQIQNGENKIIFEIWQFLSYFFSFLAFLFFRFIILQFDHVRSSLTIYTAAVFIYYSPASLAVHFIASLFPPCPSSLARSFASFCFSYISHIFLCGVSNKLHAMFYALS